MTNIAMLPKYRVTAGVGADEDFLLSMAFTLSDGVTPLSLAGIAFAMTVGSYVVLTTASGLSISGALNNVLTAYVPAAAKTAWTGVVELGLVASDGTYTADVFSGSSLTVGVDQSSPPSFSRSRYDMNTLISPYSADVARLAGSPFAGGVPVVVASATYSLPGPGWYLVTYSGGATLTLPALSAGGPIIVTDASGSVNPRHHVVGTINHDNGGAIINSPGGSLALAAVSSLSSWWKML